MLGQSVAAYKELGVTRVGVSPAWVGKYVWASFGYDVSPEQIDSLRAQLVPFLERHGIPRDRAQEHANNCRSLHHFADLDLTKDGDEATPERPGLAIHHVSSTEQNRDGSKPEFDVHLGKRFLLKDGEWTGGYVDIKNRRSPSYERVKKRLGLKD